MKPSLSKSILAAALLLAACTQMPLMHQQASNLPTSQGSIVTEAPVAPPKGMIDAGAPSVKVGLLIPLSGDSVAVGNAMLDAATMAVSDAYLTTPSDQIHSRIILIPKDTGQTAAETKVNAQQAIDQGATFIIGPLFSQSVAAVAPIAKEHHIKMLTFSNNSAVAEDGVYVFGFLPEQQVSRMAEYAYLHNLTHIALLAPNDAYGEKIKTKLLESYSQKGGTVAPAELYAPSPTNIKGAARTNTERRLSALNTPASSLARSRGAMPARSRIATEMTSPTANEPARMPACFHGEMVWRISSVKRPMPRRGGSFGAGDRGGFSRTIIATSCMIHHRAANLLTISGPVEFGNDPAPCHDPDPVGEGKDFVEVFADQHHRSPTIAGGQQPLMHGGTGPRIKPAAWAVRDHHRRLPAEFPGDHQFLGIASR